MRSSTVTAAMALILVEAVLRVGEKQRQRFRAHGAASAPADALSAVLLSAYGSPHNLRTGPELFILEEMTSQYRPEPPSPAVIAGVSRVCT